MSLKTLCGTRDSAQGKQTQIETYERSLATYNRTAAKVQAGYYRA